MLADLPAELIYKIGDEVEPILSTPGPRDGHGFVCDRAPSLISLSLVCRRLRKVILPILFASISYDANLDLDISPEEHTALLRNPFPHYPDLAVHVLKITLTLPSFDEERESEQLNYLYDVLNALPRVQVVNLEANEMIMFHPRVLELPDFHSNLAHISLRRFHIRGTSMMYYVPVNGKKYDKVILSAAYIFVQSGTLLHGQEAALAMSKNIFELGIIVETLLMCAIWNQQDPEEEETGVEFRQWVSESFNGLTTLVSEIPFALEGDKRVENFFTRHPKLSELHFSLRPAMNYTELGNVWLQTSPSMKSILDACNGFAARLGIVFRTNQSGTRSFQCTGISISLYHYVTAFTTQLSDMVAHISRTYPEVNSLNFDFLPISRTGPVSARELVSCAVISSQNSNLTDISLWFAAFYSVFRPGAFQKLAEVHITWRHAEDNWETDVAIESIEPANQYLEDNGPIGATEMKSLSLSMAKDYPCLVRIQHTAFVTKRNWRAPPRLFIYQVIRMLDGEVRLNHIRPFATGRLFRPQDGMEMGY